MECWSDGVWIAPSKITTPVLHDSNTPTDAMANTSSRRSSDNPSLRARLINVLGYAEDVVYVGLGILLAAGAFTLLITEAMRFWHVLLSGQIAELIVPLLGQLLLVIIIVELLFTVKVSFREHVLEPQPFLIVAVIAVSRRIIVLTAEISKLLSENEQTFQHALWELGVLTILAVTLVISLRLLRQEHKVAG